MKPRLPRQCNCGCGTWFTPVHKQRFLNKEHSDIHWKQYRKEYVKGYVKPSYPKPTVQLEPRLCGCGCGELFIPGYKKQVFLNQEHYQEHSRRKSFGSRTVIEHVVTCACGCGTVFTTSCKGQIYSNKTHRIRVWKRSNRDKVKAQKLRRKLKQRNQNLIDYQSQAEVRFVARSLLAYHSRWSPVLKFNRIILLSKLWKSLFGWLSTERFAHKLYSQLVKLKLAWKNVTSWTSCLSWNITYTPDPEITGGWLIYGLVDPRTLEIRYIGQSQIGVERPRQHMTKAGGENNYKNGWVKQLRKCGLRFNIVVLEVVKDGDIDTLNKSEIWWIAYGRCLGWRLTNLTAGGMGSLGRKVSRKTRKLISLARRTGGPVTEYGKKRKQRTSAPRRQAPLATHCIRGHEFNEQNTLVKRSKKNGRVCKLCLQIRSREFRDKVNKFKYL